MTYKNRFKKCSGKNEYSKNHSEWLCIKNQDRVRLSLARQLKAVHRQTSEMRQSKMKFFMRTKNQVQKFSGNGQVWHK